MSLPHRRQKRNASRKQWQRFGRRKWNNISRQRPRKLKVKSLLLLKCWNGSVGRQRYTSTVFRSPHFAAKRVIASVWYRLQPQTWAGCLIHGTGRRYLSRTHGNYGCSVSLSEARNRRSISNSMNGGRSSNALGSAYRNSHSLE